MAGLLSSGDPWTAWTYTITTSDTCTSTDTTWAIWTAADSGTANTTITIADCWNSWVETAEEAAARREAAADRARERAEARARAEELLLDSLNDEQRSEYRQHKRFHVRSRSGRRFRIDCGRQHNVFTVNDRGLAVVEHCAHVGEAVPDEDNILAQKFMLEHDEERFLRTANSRQLVASA